MTPCQQQRVNGWESGRFRRLALKVYAGEASRPEAVRLTCLQCMGYDTEQVRDCASTACPLHAFRPYAPALPA